MDPNSIRDAANQIANSSLVEEFVRHPPKLTIALIGLALLFAVASPFFTLISIRIKLWFKDKVNVAPALKWFNIIYLLVWAVMLAFVAMHYFNIKKKMEGG